MSKIKCVCGHSKSDHIYSEGACRPGFVCEQECKKFVPQEITTVRQLQAVLDDLNAIECRVELSRAIINRALENLKERVYE